MEQGFTILIPTRPQTDTIAAIFLLQKFGNERFPGISDLPLQTKIVPQLSGDASFEKLLEQKIIPLDISGSRFDHHGTDFCTSELIAQYLDIQNDPALAQLLDWVRRDDKLGKGTLSRDPLDRAFGLPGLISALNKIHTNDPDRVVRTVLPLLEAHYQAAHEHHVDLPAEVKRKRSLGHYEESEAQTDTRTIKIACVISDKPSMPTYLRSVNGPRVDVVLQKSEQRNHYCVLSRQERKIDLSMVAALIRLREGQLRGLDLGEDPTNLGRHGRVEQLGMWYVDPATNSILNGGPHSPDVEQSLIPWEEMKQIVHKGLELISGRRKIV